MDDPLEICHKARVEIGLVCLAIIIAGLVLIAVYFIR